MEQVVAIVTTGLLSTLAMLSLGVRRGWSYWKLQNAIRLDAAKKEKDGILATLVRLENERAASDKLIEQLKANVEQADVRHTAQEVKFGNRIRALDEKVVLAAREAAKLNEKIVDLYTRIDSLEVENEQLRAKNDLYMLDLREERGKVSTFSTIFEQFLSAANIQFNPMEVGDEIRK